MPMSHLEFWIGFLQIVGIDLLLSGDNAVMIALAARGLDKAQQRLAIGFGAVAAVALRVVLAVAVFEVLRLPYVKLLGGLVLLVLAVQFGRPQKEKRVGKDGLPSSPSLWRAVRTILFADALMSLDNVVVIAGAARGSLVLLVLGLAISIPLVVSGSALLLRLIARWPVVIRLGAGLIGWVAGDMIAADSALRLWLGVEVPLLAYALPAAGIALGLGASWYAARKAETPAAPSTARKPGAGAKNPP